jgi:hypothetical protein
MQLAMLSEDVQYLKDLILIRSRRSLDDAEFLDTLQDLLPQLKAHAAAGTIDLKLDIRADLARLAAAARAIPVATDFALDRERIDSGIRARLEILYAAGSLFAQNAAAGNVALVRESIAWRRHQIRAHAIYNGSYEATIQIATQRLADYYGAGLKPNQIAQLIHDLATSIALSKIAF